MYKVLHCDTLDILYILKAGIVCPSLPLKYDGKGTQTNVFDVTAVFETNAASIYCFFLTLVI